ncbi:ATP synthase F1 subunit delta [Planctomycetota bacterium]
MAVDQWHAVAEVYAEALFELALEREQTEVVGGELSQLAQLLKSQREWALFLENPGVHPSEKAAVVKRVFKDKLSNLMMDFLGVLAVRNRLAALRAIESCYGELEDKHVGRFRGKLVTAIELDQKETARLTEQISRALRKTVALQSRCDPLIIGGMILTIGDTVMDGSVRGSLNRLSRQLRQKSQQDLRAAGMLLD